MMQKFQQKRKRYNIFRSVVDLEQYITDLPDKYVHKFVSDGGFSSISFILFISSRATIREMYVSSFRIGRKELQMIDALHQSGKIGMCHFTVGSLMKDDGATGKKYKYYDDFVGVCKKNGWEYITTNNHSKILLFDTSNGKYVIETSSNLNENPKIEQFSFEKDSVLFDFYKTVFNTLRNGGE